MRENLRETVPYVHKQAMQIIYICWPDYKAILAYGLMLPVCLSSILWLTFMFIPCSVVSTNLLLCMCIDFDDMCLIMTFTSNIDLGFLHSRSL